MLQRYLDRESALLDDLFHRADELNEDPLHGYLVGLKFLSELLADLPNGHPGCLVASFCYQDQLFNRDVRESNREGILAWRSRFRTRLDQIAERYPPQIAVDLDALVYMLSALVDGGVILSKVLKDRGALPAQVMLYREFVRAVFTGPH